MEQHIKIKLFKIFYIMIIYLSCTKFLSCIWPRVSCRVFSYYMNSWIWQLTFIKRDRIFKVYRTWSLEFLMQQKTAKILILAVFYSESFTLVIVEKPLRIFEKFLKHEINYFYNNLRRDSIKSRKKNACTSSSVIQL